MQFNDAIWYGTAGAVALGALALMAWAMLGDRGRGRLRCPKCWYAMEGIAATPHGAGTTYVCPECGRQTPTERGLRKHRRRWAWVSVVILLLVAAAVAGCWPVVRRDGWTLVSTPMLANLLPIGGLDGPFGKELARRMGVLGPRSFGPSKVSAEETEYLARRCAEGVVLARPGSRRWQESYGRLIREVPWRASTAVSKRSLRGIAPQFALRTRPRWPAGIPLWIEIDKRQYWPGGDHLSAEFASPVDGYFVTDFGDGGLNWGASLSGTGTLKVDVSLSRLEPNDDPSTVYDEIALGSRTVEVPYSISGTVDDVMMPVESPELDAMLKSLTYKRDSNGGMNRSFWEARGGAADGVAFGLIMEFKLDKVPIRRQRVWWSGSVRPQPIGELTYRIEEIESDGRTLGWKGPWEAVPGENWTIRLRSDPATALRVLDCNFYWDGDIEVPLVIEALDERSIEERRRGRSR